MLKVQEKKLQTK